MKSVIYEFDPWIDQAEAWMGEEMKTSLKANTRNEQPSSRLNGGICQREG